MQPMTHVERFRAVMDFALPDRLPMVEWAPYWDLTVDRWHGEGLPETLTDPDEIAAHFGLDCWRQCWIHTAGPDTPIPARHGAGIIANAADYEQIKPSLYPQPAFDQERLKQWAAWHDDGALLLWLTLDGYFWGPRSLLGIERHLYAFYDQPELIHQINQDLSEYQLRSLDQLCEIIVPEFMTFAEDMSYNHGPMLSRAVFDEFLAPYYGKLIPALKERNILPLIDSDGDVMPLIPWLKDVGFEGILPLERMAGVDIAELRRHHPKWRMIGAFDKTVMKQGPDAMRQEFERLLPVMKQGGYIPGVDHQTPPDVSLENYRAYLDLLCEYCTKAATQR